MISEMLKNVELFNIAEARKTGLGYSLERIPVTATKYASSYGAMVGSHADGCEIRFVRESAEDRVRITLMAEYYAGNVLVMRGDRVHEVRYVKPGEIFTIEISEHPIDTLKEEEFFADDTFSHHVIRLIFTGSRFHLCSIDTFGRKIRPPRADELPKKTFLAYGSSVTLGSHAMSSSHCYISTVARSLGAQALNKGMGGSCFAEKEVVDYVMSHKADFLIFEPGTNMYGNFENDVIYERNLYALNKFFETNPNKYAFVLEPPMPHTALAEPEQYKALCETVHKLAEDVRNDKCVLIDIKAVEKSTTYVMTDLIHPFTEGHIMMGIHLAEIIKKYIGD